jgi:hypothetical protein
MLYSAPELIQKIEQFLLENEQYQGLKLYVTDDFQVFTEMQHAQAHADQGANQSRLVYRVTAGSISLAYDARQRQPVKNDEAMHYHKQFS